MIAQNSSNSIGCRSPLKIPVSRSSNSRYTLSDDRAANTSAQCAQKALAARSESSIGLPSSSKMAMPPTRLRFGDHEASCRW
eukprot:13095103-Heterocapsa_arctica.AAC.1